LAGSTCFPRNDTSVARNLTLVGGPPLLDVETLLDTLGPERGMLYYHLLLGRLETRGDLSFTVSASGD
jgi:DNA-3-methyladenine glycosylase II